MEKYNKRIDHVREARPITRVGCAIKLRVTLDKETKKWFAREFISHHSHVLPHDSHRQFLRTNRRVTNAATCTAMSMKGVRIRTCKIMSYIAKLAGDYHRVSFLRQFEQLNKRV